MLLKHFFLGKIAHSSYILAGKETCAVVDPQRDVEMYIREARALGLTITHIIETHLHADFVSGHMELAAATGATIYAPKSGQCKFPHVPVSEGDAITLEDMELRVWETPGHTPEHVSYVLIDYARGEDPIGVFCGDTLFVGDVGRPDLFPGRAEELADKLYHSLHDKLMTLPDYCEVYPLHGAGSLCGRSMGAKWLSTIGYEHRYNPALQLKDKAAFIYSLTHDMPPAPDHFARCTDINRGGPALMSSLPSLAELKPPQFEQRMTDPDIQVVDVRSYAAFSAMHIPGSWHLDLGGNFPTFAGWVLPTDKKFLLVSDDFEDALSANLWARRVGVDNIVGCLYGGMVAWVMSGRKISDVHLISSEDLHEQLLGSKPITLLDVRSPLEFADNHIEGAVNIPAPDLRTQYARLDRDKPVVIICSTGNRSSLAASILARHGFRQLQNVAGGMTGYSVAGHTHTCSMDICLDAVDSRYLEA